MPDPVPELSPPWPRLSGYSCAQMATTARILFWAWLLCAIQFKVETKHGRVNAGLMLAMPVALWACARLAKTIFIFHYGPSVILLFVCWPFADAILLLAKLVGLVTSPLWALVDLLATGGMIFAVMCILRVWGRGFFAPDLRNAYRKLERFLLVWVLLMTASATWVIVLDIPLKSPQASAGGALSFMGLDIPDASSYERIVVTAAKVVIGLATLCVSIYPLLAFGRFRRAWQFLERRPGPLVGTEEERVEVIP